MSSVERRDTRCIGGKWEKRGFGGEGGCGETNVPV